MVESLAVQRDGRILVGGNFTTKDIWDETDDSPGYARIARYNSNGSLDSSFKAYNCSSDVYCMAIQADDKIVIGGDFGWLSNDPSGATIETRHYLVRLNPDGLVDPTFDPGTNGSVVCLAVQTDGKILVGGDFTAVAGQPRNHIARLDSDGTLDSTFDPGADADAYCVAVQPDGKILLGGTFTSLGGNPRNHIGRLNRNVSIDPDFNPGVGAGGEYVESLALQADGKILLAGYFNSAAGGTRRCIARLNANGTLDSAYVPDANFTLDTVVLQSDGKVLLG